MDAQEYLEQYAGLMRRHKWFLKEHEQEKKSIEELIPLCSRSLSPKAQKEKADQSREYVAYCNRLLKQAKGAEVEAEKIRGLIESISGLEEKVLYLRYVDGCTWEQVCERSFYSWNTVWRFHDKGLHLVQEKIDKQEASG